MSGIGVAIPCYAPHYNYMPRLLRSIANQTVRPEKVVISCSSWTTNAKHTYDFEGIPVTIFFWQREVYQAENRNIAAAELTTPYISFIDADDLMHPRRLEYVLHAFQTTGCDVVCHNCQAVPRSGSADFLVEDAPNVHPNPVRVNPEGRGCVVDGYPLHHAHITIHRRVFNHIRYPTAKQFYRMEDSLYLAEVVRRGFNVRYLHNALSQYMQ